MANAYKLAQAVVGQSIDVDGFPGFQPYQCVDLVSYVGAQLGFALRGNGNQIGLQSGIGKFADVIPFSEGALRTGDIIATDEPGSAYGHTFVYGGGTLDNALIIEQNYNNIYKVIEHRRSLRYCTPLRIVRFRNQDNYSPSGGTPTTGGNTGTDVGKIVYIVYEVTCDKTEGLDGIGGKVVDTFFKCNKVSGQINGEWLIYNRYTGGKGYIRKSCVKEKTDYKKAKIELSDGANINPYEKNRDVTTDGVNQKESNVVYSPEQFLQLGKISWRGFDWVYEVQSKFPSDIAIPGRVTNAHGYLADKDGYIVLEAPENWGNSLGNVYDTPFGHKGKVYSIRGEDDNFVVYIK